MRALGVPDLAVLVLPHPIGQISDKALEAIADQSFGEVQFALTAETDLVAAAYRDATKSRSNYPQ